MSTYNVDTLNSNGVDSIAELAVKAGEPVELEPGTLYAVPGKDGDIVALDTDAWADTPRRATGARTVTDAASFVKYVNRHVSEGTEVYAHTLSSSVVAVLDSHEGGVAGSPGWEKHKLTLALEHTKAWQAWAKHDQSDESTREPWFDQVAFAEFIEARALDVIEPDHARLIEIATTFEAKKSADFNSSTRLDNGDVKFEFSETLASKAGAKGDIEIPKKLRLAIRPYVGGPIYSVWASFRYRLNNGTLRLGYALERPENILEAAFTDIVTEIRDGKTERLEGEEAGKPIEREVHAGIGQVPIFYGRATAISRP